jgi:hypothetical protein
VSAGVKRQPSVGKDMKFGMISSDHSESGYLITIFSFHSFAGFITKTGSVLDMSLSLGLVKDKLGVRTVETKSWEI